MNGFDACAKRTMPPFAKLWLEEEGQGLAEYGLILGLVAVACVAALTGMGDSINSFLTRTAGSLNK